MSESIKVVDSIDDDLRQEFLNEIMSQPQTWIESDDWSKEHVPYLSKNKTCIGLIAGRQEPYEHTPFYCRFPKITNYLSGKNRILTRINIQKIAVFSKYSMHIDTGDYFLNKDRFALCVQSPYKMVVGSVSKRINPGEVIWFDNKQPHEAINIGTKDRIAIVFDVPRG